MMLESSIGCVNDSSCLGWFSSLAFQSSWNPGFCMLSFEIRGSVLTHAVRCASLLVVVQLEPPRPCAYAALAATSARTMDKAAERPGLLITTAPLTYF